METINIDTNSWHHKFMERWNQLSPGTEAYWRREQKKSVDSCWYTRLFVWSLLKCLLICSLIGVVAFCWLWGTSQILIALFGGVSHEAFVDAMKSTPGGAILVVSYIVDVLVLFFGVIVGGTWLQQRYWYRFTAWLSKTRNDRFAKKVAAGKLKAESSSAVKLYRAFKEKYCCKVEFQ